MITSVEGKVNTTKKQHLSVFKPPTEAAYKPDVRCDFTTVFLSP